MKPKVAFDCNQYLQRHSKVEIFRNQYRLLTGSSTYFANEVVLTLPKK